MTSTDAADTTDTEAVVETVGGEETAPKDTAHVTESKETKELKEVPKPDLPRLPKPDRRDLDGKVAEMQEAADVQQARIEELKRAIETRRDARKNVGLGSQGTKTRIQELNQQFQQRMEERNAIRKELLGLNAVQEKLREQANGMKSKLKFLTVEQVDREIQRLEDAIAHTTMPLNEEKKMVTAIKDLGKSRETVREYQASYAKLNGDDGSRAAVVASLKQKDLEINAVKAEQNELRGALTVTKKKEDKASEGIPKLNDERNACYEVIKGKREEIRGLRAEFKKKEDEYFNRERLWRAYLKVEQQKKWEAGLEERKAREAAKKQWELENAPEPFEAEVTAAEQLIAYLAKWDTEESKESKAEKEKKEAEAKAKLEAEKLAEEKAADAFKGMSIAPKKEKSGMFGLSGGAVKGKKGKKFGKKSAENVSAEPAKPKNERLQIPFDAYGSFAKLSVDVPLMTGDVPTCIASIRTKKAEFLEKRRFKKERQAAGLEDEDEKKEKSEKNEKTKKSKNGQGGKKGARLVSVSLEVEGEAVTCVIAVNEK